MSSSLMRPNPLLLPVSIFVGIIFGTFVFLAAKVYRPPPVDSLDVEFWDLLGRPVPQVEMMGLDGRSVSSHRFAGQVHLLFFGMAGCDACDEVYPALKQAAERLPVLLVGAQGLAALQVKVVEEGFSFSVAYDSLEVLIGPLHVSGYPTAMWVDTEGRIVKAASGNRSSTKIIELALASLSEEERR